MSPALDFDLIRAARDRIRGRVERTPVCNSPEFDRLAGAEVHFKCENLQRGGAFKLRGALNAILSLDDATAARGVVAHSSGNHGAAIALAARERGISARIVVPSNTTRAKLEAIRAHGGQLTLCEPTLAAREREAGAIAAATGGTFIHPFDNPMVIAGQGTATLELLEDQPAIEIMITPVSGGGLLSGTALAAHGVNPAMSVVGAEPKEANDAARSLATGRIEGNRSTNTCADGLRATLCPRTFAIIREHVTEIVTVSEEEIIQAVRVFREIFDMVIEPSSAVPVAALLARRIGHSAGRRIGVIISGGNVEP